MKINLLFFLFTSFCFGQFQTHTYQISDNTIEYDTGDLKVIYDFDAYNFTSGLSTMNDHSIVVDGIIYEYHLNRITLNDTTYKFKKPWFSNKAYLVDITTGNILIEFQTDHKDQNAQQEFVDDNWLQLDAQKQKVLSRWALNKQVAYAYYNASEADLGDTIIDAAIAGAIAGALLN
jgi:hypothetical protein